MSKQNINHILDGAGRSWIARYFNIAPASVTNWERRSTPPDRIRYFALALPELFGTEEQERVRQLRQRLIDRGYLDPATEGKQ